MNNVSDSVIDPIDTVTVMLYALASTCVAEFGMWLLIYSKDDYKNLKKNIEQVSTKLNKQKDQYVIQSQTKNHEKKLSQIENQFKVLNQEMTASRMKSTFLIGIFMIIALSSFGSVFQGIVVARLPFQPFFLIQELTHRGILGDDYTECSYIFIYILSTIVIRGNIQKIFGFEPPQSHNKFFMNGGRTR